MLTLFEKKDMRKVIQLVRTATNTVDCDPAPDRLNLFKS